MVKNYLPLILFLLSVNDGLAQTKYLIYFNDKVVSPSYNLSKSDLVYQQALNELSDKSIERRTKHLSENEIITFEDLPIKTEYINAIESLGILIDNKLKWFNAVSAYLTESQVSSVLTLPFVEKIEQVKILIYKNPDLTHSQLIQTNKYSEILLDYGPSFGQLQLSEVPFVHSKGISGSGILIGLLDTGFDWQNHESLTGLNVIDEYDFVFNDPVTANQNNDNPAQHNHGTLVLSVIGGFKEGSLIGSAFGSDFILSKTEDIRSETHVEEDNYAAALEWMENYGVDITSSSLGYSIFDPLTYSYTYSDMDGKSTIVTRAAELSFRRGVITITSAGNEGATLWRYITAPADGINTIAVGAVDNGNNVAAFSSRGPSFDGRIKPEIVTQGVSVYGAFAGNFSGYGTASGTSLSSPIASGIAALLLSAHPHLKNSQVRNILIESSDNNQVPDNNRGYGLVSALRAVEFPNLKESGNRYEINKIFLQPQSIDPQSVTIHYSTDGQTFEPMQMVFDPNFFYSFQLPYFFDGDLVEFFFTFSDSSANSFRVPAADNFRFYYGELDISLNLDPEKTFTDYIVSDAYPNPFAPSLHTFTRVAIKSSGNENLKIIITDAAGQKVVDYKSLTNEGENYFDWYGISLNSIPVSSGVYFILVEVNGKQYGRKLILLR